MWNRGPKFRSTALGFEVALLEKSSGPLTAADPYRLYPGFHDARRHAPGHRAATLKR
jgi:hypothetical protein